jgi:hypothetical protein
MKKDSEAYRPQVIPKRCSAHRARRTKGLFGVEWRLSPAPKPEIRRRLKRRSGSCAPRIAKGNALGSRTPAETGCKGLARGGRVGVAHATGKCALVLNCPSAGMSAPTQNHGSFALDLIRAVVAEQEV